MPNAMQEKFQVIAKKPKQVSNEWSSLDANRKAKSQTKLQMPGYQDYGKDMPVTLDSNPLGPDGSASAMDLRDGYKVSPMKPYDDEFTNQHVDEFYSEVGGFSERSNYLDRI